MKILVVFASNVYLLYTTYATLLTWIVCLRSSFTGVKQLLCFYWLIYIHIYILFIYVYIYLYIFIYNYRPRTDPCGTPENISFRGHSNDICLLPST